MRSSLAVLYAYLRVFHVNHILEGSTPPPPTHVEPDAEPQSPLQSPNVRARAHRAGRQNVRSWPKKFSFYITDLLVFDSEARPLAGLRVEFSQAHLLLGA